MIKIEYNPITDQIRLGSIVVIGDQLSSYQFHEVPRMRIPWIRSPFHAVIDIITKQGRSYSVEVENEDMLNDALRALSLSLKDQLARRTRNGGEQDA